MFYKVPVLLLASILDEYLDLDLAKLKVLADVLDIYLVVMWYRKPV